MTGRISSRGWFALGAASGAVVVAAAVALWSFAPVVCTAMGYADLSPIQLRLPAGTSGQAEVAACFDLDCTPVPLAPDDSGGYAVPQDESYRGSGERLDVSATGVYVQVRDGGTLVASNRFGIEAVSDAPFWSRCPGPFHYGPVTVGG